MGDARTDDDSVSLDALPPRRTGLRWVMFVLLNNKAPNGASPKQGKIHAWWVRRVSRQFRLFLYGLLLAVAGIGVLKAGSEPAALVVGGYGGWMMSAAKFR